MSCKRSYTDQDPDYENDLSNDQKRLKVIEKDNKEATIRKIQQIITSQFNHEVKLKEAEAKEINEKLYQALKMLDQLRISVISSYYSFDKPCETAIVNASEYQPPIHPSVKKYIGKKPNQNLTSSVLPETAPAPVASKNNALFTPNCRKSTVDKEQVEFAKTISTSLSIPHPSTPPPPATVRPPDNDGGGRAARFKIKKRVVVGNVSKYIPLDKREERDQSTHKWMVYVRGPKEEPFIETFVKKVWFFLHPSYRPNDLVEVNHPPFHLTRRGWGEFPVRIQLHFHNSRNKRVDIIHTLKLDTTYTGLQTLGSETVVDVLILKPDLPLSETAEKNDLNAVGHVVPHDIGGIVIPAEVKESSNTESKILKNRINLKSNVPEPNGAVTKLMFGEELLKEITSIPVKNNVKAHIKEEIVEKDDKSCSEQFLNSFMNDHGTYFNPIVAQSMRSVCANSSTLATVNQDSLVSKSAVLESVVKIKQELQDDYGIEDVDLCNGLLPLNSTLRAFKQESSKDIGHFSIMDQLVTPNMSLTQVNTSTNQRNRNICPMSTASSSTTSTTDLIHTKSLINTKIASDSGNQELKFQFDSASKINNLPVLVIPQKSQITTNSTSATVANISIKTPLPTNMIQQSSPIVAGDLAKSVNQSQTSNGVATFVKCVDKLGNLYLIPLAMFLKMNPSAQTNILQSASNPASNMPSLLKPTPPAAVNLTANTNFITSRPKVPSPSVVSFPAARSNSSSVQQSLLINSKAINSTPANNLNKSVLLPQNSVSLLAGTPPRSKLSLGSSGPSSSAKTMISCLVKNRLTANTKGLASNVTKEIPSLNLDLFESMDGIVRHLAKIYPLITPNPDRSVHPYCAASLNDFFQWNVGKRHAAEWQRARAIRSKILLDTSNSVKWKSGHVWSVKRLLLWCRHYGYSPIKIAEHQGDNIELPETVEPGNSVKFVTYTVATELLDLLKKESGKLKEKLVEPDKDDEEEEDVDVVGIDDKPKLKAETSPTKSVNDFVVRLSSTPTGEFVREIVEQVGMKLLPEEVCKDTVAPLAEEVLFSAMKQFAEDILSSANANAFQTRGIGQRPSIITAQHVGNAIRELPHCDFLTNCYLGTRIQKSHFDIMGSVKL